MIRRREFLGLAAVGGVGAVVAARSAAWPSAAPGPRLALRPREPTSTLAAGKHALKLGDAQRDGWCYVPTSADSKLAAPLLIALHGATQQGQLMIDFLTPVANVTGCIVLAPDSRDITWDAIRGAYGADLEFIRRSSAWVFDRRRIDPKRLWMSGFSDGASYALGVGLSNGDVFSRVLAFSPGFITDVEVTKQRPRVFVSHGQRDKILPIDRTSRLIVPDLRKAGYEVEFMEHSDGHWVTPEVIQSAVQWLKS